MNRKQFILLLAVLGVLGAIGLGLVPLLVALAGLALALARRRRQGALA